MAADDADLVGDLSVPAGSAAPAEPSRLTLHLGTGPAVAAALLAATLAVAVGLAALPDGDVGLYHQYALAFWHRSGPAVLLPTEYPAWSILPFTLTLVVLGLGYQASFVVGMTLLFLLGWLLVARLRPSASVAYVVLLLVGGVGTLFARYDLAPSLLAVGAVAAMSRRRPWLAYGLLAAAVLLKLYPIVLFPVLLIEGWRQATTGENPRSRGRALAGPPLGFGLLVGVGFAIPARLDPAGWMSPLHVLAARPTQLESIPATLLWVASWAGISSHPDRTYNSFNLVGPSDAGLRVLALVVLGLGSGMVYLRQWRGSLPLLEAALASVCVVLISSRVLSPQYMIWVLPLVALAYGLDPLWLAIAALTALVYPVLYAQEGLLDMPSTPAAYDPVLLAAIGLRNALLVAATVRVVMSSSSRFGPAVTAAARVGALPRQ